jgi:tetratricopeptide (TPR) repeat protein
LITQRKAEEAIPILDEVIRLQPDYADAYYQLGKAQLQMDSDSSRLLALANLETAAHLNPSAPYIFFQLAQAYRGFDRMEESQQALQRYRSLKKAEEEARLKGMQEPPGG